MPAKHHKVTKRLRHSKPPPISSPSTTSPSSPILFWRPHEIPHGIFSQWFPSPITSPLLPLHPSTPPTPQTFTSTEQYLMAHKAHLFNPLDTSFLTQILSTPDPSTQRTLGRQLPNFDEPTWHLHRFDIVVQGNYLKFTQNSELKRVLLETGERELVEASPSDRIWGVGFGAKNAEKRREDWGLNLLGKALMEVRRRIRNEEELEKEQEELEKDGGNGKGERLKDKENDDGAEQEGEK